MPRPIGLYGIVSIILMILLGLGILYLNINGVIDNVVALVFLAVPAILIVAAIRLFGSDTADPY